MSSCAAARTKSADMNVGRPGIPVSGEKLTTPPRSSRGAPTRHMPRMKSISPMTAEYDTNSEKMSATINPPLSQGALR